MFLKEDKLKALKTICNCLLVFIVVMAICVIIGYIYYHFFVKDTTIGVNNIDNQVGMDIQEIIKSDDLSEEEKDKMKDRYFLEVNYYSNDKNNGIMLQELKMNYFTSFNLTSADYRSTGMQYVGDYKGLPLNTWDGKSEVSFLKLSGKNDRYYGTSKESVQIANNYVDKNFNYYDYTNDINWNGVTNENGSIATELKRTTEFIIKIDDRAFSIALNKYFDKDVGDVRNIFGVGWKVGEVYNRYYYTYGSLFQSCMQAVKTNSAGYGDYYITVDLSSLYSIKEYDIESGKFKTDNVTNIIKTYSVLKFHYDENGARNSTQSMFGIIDNNSKYDIEEDKIDTSYWQERMTYNLDHTSKLNGTPLFEYRYSEIYNGYFVSLSMDGKKLFANMPRAKVNVIIDLQQDIKIVGIDYNGFENVELDTFTIRGNIDTFYLLDNSLSNTSLKTLKYSKGIVLDNIDKAINSEFVEVVIWWKQ